MKIDTDRSVICILDLRGSTEVDVKVLTGPGGSDLTRRIYAGARWQFFADGTFLFTPGPTAEARDDLFPLSGFFRREAQFLAFHGARHSELGASIVLAGFLTGADDRPSLVAIEAAHSVATTKVVGVTQPLSRWSGDIDDRHWPPLPSTYDVTLQGHVGTAPFGPLSSLLVLCAPAEGDSNPFSLGLESRDLNCEGSLSLTSFLSSSEIKVQFMTLSTEPDQHRIEARLLPGAGGAYGPLKPSWCYLRQPVGLPSLPPIPDWIQAEEAVLRIRLCGRELSGELAAKGMSRRPGEVQNQSYRATLEGRRREADAVALPPTQPSQHTEGSLFAGRWSFEGFGSVTLRQAHTSVHGTLGDGGAMSGEAKGRVLAWRRDEKGGEPGFFLFLANRRQLAALFPDKAGAGWQLALGENLDGPLLRQLEIPASSRQDLKYRGYDLVLEGRCAEAVDCLAQAQILYRQDRERTDLPEVMQDSSLIDEINILIRLSACYRTLGRFDDLLSVLRQHVEITRKLASRSYLKGIAGAPGFEGQLSQNLESFRRQLRGDLERIQALDASRVFFDELIALLLELDQAADALVASEKSRARAFADLLAAHAPVRSLPEGQLLSAGVTVPVTDAILRSAVEASRSVVVEYLITDQHLIVWVVAPHAAPRVERVTISRKELVDSIEELLARLGSLRHSPRHGELPPPRADKFVSAGGMPQQEPMTGALRRLHRLLIEPILSHLPEEPGARVTIVPQGPLFLVPFPALLDDQHRPLLSRFTLATTPAIGTLASLHRPSDQGFQSGEVLVAGNPELSSTWRHLAPLGGAEEEARRLGERFHCPPLVGPAATKEAVVAAMPAARLIHLACHGLLGHGEGPGLPGALVFAAQTGDGLLTSGEISNLRLCADLVVLSACNSGLGRVTGDGVLGLSRSFLIAGAKGVIVSLWNVGDASTALLMTEFYRHLEMDQDRAAALRQAMLATRERYSAPKSWAAFTFIGLEPAAHP